MIVGGSKLANGGVCRAGCLFDQLFEGHQHRNIQRMSLVVGANGRSL